MLRRKKSYLERKLIIKCVVAIVSLHNILVNAKGERLEDIWEKKMMFLSLKKGQPNLFLNKAQNFELTIWLLKLIP